MNEFNLQETVDNLPGSIFYKDKNLIFTACNQNFLDIFDLDSPEDVIGKRNADLEMFNSYDYISRFEDEDRLALQGNQVIMYLRILKTI